MYDTSGRVQQVTPEHVNEAIARRIECSIVHHALRPERIEQRLEKLDQEWDLERTLQAQASSMVLAGVVLSLVRGRRWLGLSVFSGYFLLQHAMTGWCPPVSVFRRLGVRTAREIDQERFALKALRGDFDDVSAAKDPLERALVALGSTEQPVQRSKARPRPQAAVPDDPALQVRPGEARHGAGRRPRGRDEDAAPPGFADGV
jgi:hypothetical protein